MSVSVIIPSWNRKELLATTLENVLGQSLAPSEVIVVDDHSTDGTHDFIKDKFKDRVKVISNVGKGPGAARNTGFRHSTGKYIKFFDSDDLMTLNTLETQVKVLERTGNDAVYSAYFHASYHNGTWELTDPAILQYKPFPASKSFSGWMLRGLFITIPSFLFTRTLIEKVGAWRTDITTYEDWDFQWRIAGYVPQPEHTNACAFLYRKHGVQTTGVNFNSSQRDREKIICFNDVLRTLDQRAGISPLDRLLFETTIANTPGQNPGVKYKVLSFIQRLANKQGRVSTGSNWQPMHGPLIDFKKVDNYIKLIDPSFDLNLTAERK